MKTTSLFLTLFIAGSSFVQAAVPNTYDISFHLAQREKFYTSYLETQKDVNNIEKVEALKIWKELKEKEIARFNSYITGTLKKSIYSQSVIDWFAHYQMTGQFKKSAEILSSYYQSLAIFLWEASTNPQSAALDKQQIRLSIDPAFQTARRIESCLTKTTAAAGKTISALQSVITACVTADAGAENMLQAARRLMNVKNYSGPNQVLSLTGFIPGNKVEQLVQNQYDAEFIKYLAPMTSTVQKNYASHSVQDFKIKMDSPAAALTNFFTESEGFPALAKDHKNWNLLLKNGQKNIYGAVFQAIDKAQESIFIDVFFLGGSVGASLAKHLIEQVQKKPNLQVYIINDRFNPLSYDNEMAPVYNYLRAYSEKFPSDRLVIMTPRIDLKRTAFPAIADDVMNDQTLKFILSEYSRTELKKQWDFYPKAKSDHSKVILIDAKNKTSGIAFVGSKNYTDSSGAIAYDEVTQIQGPAVPIILDSYYYDLTEALTELQKSSPGFFASLGSARGITTTDVSQAVRKLLSAFDVMNRAGSTPSIQKPDLAWPIAGTATLSIGENNVYGTIRSALPQDISLIQSAEKQIIISDQFLYDPQIIRALLEKIQKNQQLKVYIMLATMEDELDPTKQFAHVPNISYIDTLKATGQVFAKWKKVPDADVAALKEVNQKYNVKLAPEYHLKAISIDGVTADLKGLCKDPQRNTSALLEAMTKIPALVSGSANKDVLTMTGGFREFQVVVYDRPATVAHDCQFWQRFDDADQSKSISNETMNLPVELTNVGIDGVLLNQIIRNMIHLTYGAITGYFTN